MKIVYWNKIVFSSICVLSLKSRVQKAFKKCEIN